MNSYKKLLTSQSTTGSQLVVGLDTDLDKIPKHFKNDINSIAEFNYEIIQATNDVCCGYKINFAFYEQYGSKGFEVLEKTFSAIPSGLFSIADAKRADIGNTSLRYAKSVFEYFKADSITVSPYMGHDSVSPFLEYSDKMVFLLALTSNRGSSDFQKLVSNEKQIYKHVISTSMQWAPKENIGFVVGGTHPNELSEVRDITPDRVLLIPGLGAQGANPQDIISANNGGVMLIAASRAIIYASSGEDFAETARQKAIEFNNALLL